MVQLDSVKAGCVQPLYASAVNWEQYQHTPPRASKDHQKGQGMESGTECTQEMPFLVRSPAPVTGGTVVITGAPHALRVAESRQWTSRSDVIDVSGSALWGFLFKSSWWSRCLVTEAALPVAGHTSTAPGAAATGALP